MTNNYRLANKLRREFRERGADVGGMRATTTSELMRRAEMGRDPRINCAEQAFRENYNRQNSRRSPSQSASPRMRQNSMAGASRMDAAHRTAQNSEARRKNPMQGQQQAETLRTYRNTPAGTASTAAPYAPASAVKAEKQVQKKMIPPMMLAFLIIGTILFLSFIFSITEVYEASRQLDELKNQLGQLEETAQDMELQLEEKNDIREIEAIATGELGMTKEDSLQRRFVSLSDGERIELTEMTEEATAGGVMLSSVFSALGRFFERFR